MWYAKRDQGNTVTLKRLRNIPWNDMPFQDGWDLLRGLLFAHQILYQYWVSAHHAVHYHPTKSASFLQIMNKIITFSHCARFVKISNSWRNTSYPRNIEKQKSEKKPHYRTIFEWPNHHFFKYRSWKIAENPAIAEELWATKLYAIKYTMYN